MEEMIMPESATQSLPKSQFPLCTRCHKPVNQLTTVPIHNHPNMVMIEYECHGEHAMQEIDASMLSSQQGLSSYTVFNDYTSGLLKSTT
jgi:hypothetical protein